MTIKRRLFIANIIMVLSPIILTAILFFGIRFLLVDGDAQTRGGLGGRFADMPNIPAVSASEASDIFAEGSFSYVTSDISLYRSELGDYIIVLSDADREALEAFVSGSDFTLPVILFYLFAVVILANIFLAKYITRRIMTPINTLADGVHEIADGNLTHRIQYKGGDEFDAVCADFNEMAARLSDMVEQRQADENSRKELIAGISHDLRTPLTSVKAYLEGLRKGIASTPDMQEKYLDTIQQKTEDIEYIIKQLFLFSQIDIGEFPLHLEPVDIGNELAGMLDGFADEYKARGLTVTLKENTHGDVLIDAVQFQNIVQNILGNSVKYCKRPDARAEIACRKTDDNSLSITIRDNGPGVPADMLPKLFDIFYRGDEARNHPADGSGLGLAISAKMIERLHGSIRAENVPDGGLSMIITLPIQKGGDEA
ncbi:MAG: ATP-binding protein [Oscillospiraceae bacterium]|nr:ATP-binding protein [Oscillospiraceae bacterium]